MTAQNSPYRKRAAFPGSVFLDGFHGIRRATWVVSARRRQQGANPPLVGSDDQYDDGLHASGFASKIRINAAPTSLICSANSSKLRSYAVNRQRITASHRAFRGSSSSRTSSRIRRFSLLRATAVRPPFGTTRPMRMNRAGDASPRTSRSNVRTRVP